MPSRTPTTLCEAWHASQKFRFLVVGGWNTVFGYLVFVVLYGLLAAYAHYLVIATAAHFLAVIQSFVSQRRLVFHAAGRWLPQYLRFNAASLAALFGSLALLSMLVETVGLDVLVAQAVTTAASVAVSYLLHKHFSFKAL